MKDKLFGWLRGGAKAGTDDTALAPLLPALRPLLATEPDQARYLAAFAYLLGRVACADGVVTQSEEARMGDILRNFSSLARGEVDLLLKLVKSEVIFGSDAGDDAVAIFAELAPEGAARDLVGCLYAVAAADGHIGADEEATIAGMVDALGVDAAYLAKVRKSYAPFSS